MTIRANNLGVMFDSKWVFRSFDFELNDGQRKALVGPSGSGKSVLLKSLALLIGTDEGSVQFDSREVEPHEVPAFRSKVMYVPQRIADSDGSVEDYFREPFRLVVHQDKNWNSEFAVEQLATFGRDKEFLQKRQRDLSGGERQFVALIRTLMLEPATLLLDEPTSAMDGENARRAESLLQGWIHGSSSSSYVWVTHDFDQAQRVSDEVVRMDSSEK